MPGYLGGMNGWFNCYNNAVSIADIISIKEETWRENGHVCTIHMNHSCVTDCSCSILGCACVVPTVGCHDRHDCQDARPVTNLRGCDPHV
jgi:hypothetical protein